MSAAFQSTLRDRAERHLIGHRRLMSQIDQTLGSLVNLVEEAIVHRRHNHVAINAVRDTQGEVIAQKIATHLGHEDAFAKFLGQRISGTDLGRLLYSPAASAYYTPFKHTPIPTALKQDTT